MTDHTPFDLLVADGPSAENYLRVRLSRSNSAAMPRLSRRRLTQLKRHILRAVRHGVLRFEEADLIRQALTSTAQVRRMWARA